MSDVKNNQAMGNPRPDDFDLNDFDSFAQQARNEAEVAEVAVALTNIANNQHDVKLLMQSVMAALANRAKHEATRDAALVNRLVSPSALNEAARVGSYNGAKDFSAETVRQFNEVVTLVNRVDWRLKEDSQARAQERKIWVRSTTYAACTAAFAILAGVGFGCWLGMDAGTKHGYAMARDEKTAASWVLTPSGRFATALYQNGVLDRMRTCNSESYIPKKYNGQAVCYTREGWFLP